MKSLPKEQYDAVLYCDILGFTAMEAGRIIGVTGRTIRTRLREARDSLKTKLS